VTWFFHLWRSLAIFFAPLRVTPKCSVNVVCQVFCGLPFGLLPSSGIQIMATFAGLSSLLSVSAHNQPVSSAMLLLFRTEVSFQTFPSSHYSHGHSVIFSVFSGYTANGKRLWCDEFLLSISMFCRHEAMSLARVKCRGAELGSVTDGVSCVLTIQDWIFGKLRLLCPVSHVCPFPDWFHWKCSYPDTEIL